MFDSWQVKRLAEHRVQRHVAAWQQWEIPRSPEDGQHKAEALHEPKIQWAQRRHTAVQIILAKREGDHDRVAKLRAAPKRCKSGRVGMR